MLCIYIQYIHMIYIDILYVHIIYIYIFYIMYSLVVKANIYIYIYTWIILWELLEHSEGQVKLTEHRFQWKHAYFFPPVACLNDWNWHQLTDRNCTIFEDRKKRVWILVRSVWWRKTFAKCGRISSELDSNEQNLKTPKIAFQKYVERPTFGLRCLWHLPPHGFYPQVLVGSQKRWRFGRCFWDSVRDASGIWMIPESQWWARKWWKQYSVYMDVSKNRGKTPKMDGL